MDKVLAIQNCGISGTNFLQSLLDGHPQILSMPALHGQTLLNFWERCSSLSTEELLNKFINDHPWFFHRTDFGTMFGLCDMGETQDQTACVNQEKFRGYLTIECQGNLTRKQFVEGVFKAYNRALGRVIDESAWLLYPIHCQPEQYAKQLTEDFSTVRFIHTVREPIQNIGSITNHISKNPDWNKCYLLSCAIAQIFCDYTVHAGDRNKFGAVIPRPAFGLNPYVPNSQSVETRALKLEDLHKTPHETLAKLCEYLGIEWNNCLLQSTFDGKLWHNRPETIRQTGIGTQTISQKHEHLLNDFDRKRLEYLAKPFKEFYGYETSVSEPNFLTNLLFLLPFKMEKLKRPNNYSGYVNSRIKWIFPALRKTKGKNTFISLI